MADEHQVKIDRAQFHERLGQLIAVWKADKRSGEGLWGGVNSISIVLGKADDGGYQKANALHVSTTSKNEKQLTVFSSGYLATNFRLH